MVRNIRIAAILLTISVGVLVLGTLVYRGGGEEGNGAMPAGTGGVTKVSAPKVDIVASDTAKDDQADDSQTLAGNKLPEKFLIDVPFTSQAPYANWDEFHEEACEEASLVMLVYYLRRARIDQEAAEREILGLIRHEIKNYDDHQDSNAEEIVKLARDYYGIDNLKVVYDFGPQDLKREVAKGNPVILPVAGRELGNPNFKQPGPLYHVLVLIGYDRERMITNDPGTRNGRHYEYSLSTLFAAIHDFPGDKEKILDGRKAMIVVADGSGR